jgi:hypothetical protein
MLEKLLGIILKDPCKTCLVRARCSHLPIFSRPACKPKNDWRDKTNRLYFITSIISNVCLASILILICLMISITFILGIWKWIDLFILYL